VRLRGR